MWVFEWTGEEFLPAIKDPSFVYQHLHRYAFASEFLRGKHVLDLIAGDGSGANMLAATASFVVGIVADERIARHLAEKYKRPNLRFIAGSLPDMLTKDENRFDAISCFDGAEYGINPEPVLQAIKRLLKPEGLFVFSATTEERRLNGTGTAPQTEEWTVEKLQQLLTPHFNSVQVFAQGIYANSSIWPVGHTRNPRVVEIVMARSDTDEFQAVRGERRSSSCLIAVASDSATATRLSGSVFIDEGNELLADKDQLVQELTENKTYQAKALEWSEAQLADRRESLASLQEGFAWQKSQIASLSKTRDYLESEIRHYRETIASQEEALAWRGSQVEDLEFAVEELNKGIATRLDELLRDNEELRGERDRLENEKNQLEREKGGLAHEVDRSRNLAWELEAIKKSAGWKFVLRVRSIRERLLPTGSLRHRLYRKILRLGKSE